MCVRGLTRGFHADGAAVESVFTNCGQVFSLCEAVYVLHEHPVSAESGCITG